MSDVYTMSTCKQYGYIIHTYMCVCIILHLSSYVSVYKQHIYTLGSLFISFPSCAWIHCISCNIDSIIFNLIRIFQLFYTLTIVSTPSSPPVTSPPKYSQLVITIHSSFLTIQKGTGLPWAQIKHGTSSQGRTELIPLYKGWKKFSKAN